MVGKFADHRTQTVTLEKLIFILFQVQDNIRAPALLLECLDGEGAFAVRLPFDAILCIITCAAADQRDAVGNDIGRIETDAELADEARVQFSLSMLRRIERSASPS